MRVVIDTNVYLSSLLFKGKAREVYDNCVEIHDVFISDFIVNEVSDKLHHKFDVSARKIKRIINSILTVIEKVELTTPLPDICRDADDNYILQLCHTVTTDFLITGDKDLLILQSYRSTQILSPAEFMKLVK